MPTSGLRTPVPCESVVKAVAGVVEPTGSAAEDGSHGGTVKRTLIGADRAVIEEPSLTKAERLERLPVPEESFAVGAASRTPEVAVAMDVVEAQRFRTIAPPRRSEGCAIGFVYTKPYDVAHGVKRMLPVVVGQNNDAQDRLTCGTSSAHPAPPLDDNTRAG